MGKQGRQIDHAGLSFQFLFEVDHDLRFKIAEIVDVDPPGIQIIDVGILGGVVPLLAGGGQNVTDAAQSVIAAFRQQFAGRQVAPTGDLARVGFRLTEVGHDVIIALFTDDGIGFDNGGIAGGISQALISTQMGLAVSIPGLIVNGMLNKKQGDIEMELAQIVDRASLAGGVKEAMP